VLLGQAPKPATPLPGDWPMFSHDLSSTRFSPLTQISAKNVSKLTRAWTYRLRSDAEMNNAGGAGYSEITPLVVNGVMYLTAGNRVLALDPETGKEMWKYTVTGGNASTRGVTYWPGDAKLPPRIIFTSGRRMMALSALTGESVLEFGKNGEVELVVAYNSPPTIYKNLLFVGANVSEQPATGPSGNTRAYDARTGEKVWEFNSVPRPGEVGNETWEGDAWKDRTGVNNWGFFMTVDAERGILYTVFGSPASDFYGGDRKGNNLFGNSVVALDAATGKLKWYFQVVHHDLWDMDLPPAPVLLDVTVKGKSVPVLAQTGKVGYVYILDRVTGKPVFGVNEQPVATACRDLAEKSGTLVNEGPFTPWVYREAGAPPTSSVIFPGAIGGTDWGGMSSDPKAGLIFVNTSNYGSIGWVEKKAANARVPYDQTSVFGNPVASKFWDRKVDDRGRLLGEQSWPCQKPPWGQLTAINVSTGDIAWQVTLGITDELPEGKKNTGRVNLGGSIATAGGLVFIGATNDRRFRAFDSKNGKELWSTKLDYSAISVPITYRGKNGKQYVAISASGGGAITDPNSANTESLHVFALP
jgi:PQQ-dependent dehydrogenase (methanol/ethanol family)